MAWSAATTSASGVECDTQPCFLHWPVNGNTVLGPSKHRWTPLVDLLVFELPAKSASAKRCGEMSSAASPTHPVWRRW